MIYHILNGDSLAHSFPATGLRGQVVIFRECLIDGDLSGNSLAEFWKARSGFIEAAYPPGPGNRDSPDSYYRGIITEVEKILNAPDGSEFNLWFEYDLFCQANMWFLLSVINDIPRTKEVYAVYTSYLKPGEQNFWNGFGPATTAELLSSHEQRTRFEDTDLQFGNELWHAYKHGDLEKLRSLSLRHPPTFPYIGPVIEAHIERFPVGKEKGRPERVLEDIIGKGITDFHQVFREFWSRESIYGFGDLQVKKLLDKLMDS